MKSILPCLSLIMLFTACNENPAPEDVKLMEMVAIEQLQRNNDLITGIRNNLEFYGAVSGEERYYENSRHLGAVRMELLRKEMPGGLLAYNDTLSHHLTKISESKEYIGDVSWNEYDEQLRVYYLKQVTEDFDSLGYYKLFYITMKKEYALHLLNAEMMAH